MPVSSTMTGYDQQDDMLKVKSVQKKFRDSFGGASLDTTKWTSSVGSGASITLGSGVMNMVSGVVANAETYILSKEVFTIPFRVSIGFTMSQRIANQEFFVEMVSVDPVTGVPDGKNSVAWDFDSTTATSAKYLVSNSGLTPLASGYVTVPTTASGGIYEIEPFADEVWFHGGTLDSTSGRANSYRRHQQIPDPNAVYKLRLRWKNGATAPASTTTAVVQYVSVQDYAELTAEITAGRGQGVAGQAIAAAVVSMPTVTINSPAVYESPSTTAGGYASLGKLIAAATTNATAIKTSAGVLGALIATNLSAATKYVKLYNKASAPTVGTDVPVYVFPIPAGGMLQLTDLKTRFTTGIALAITGGIADTDTTAVAASDVVVNWEYV